MVIIITDKYLESTYVKVHSWRWRWPKKPHAFPATARWVDSCSRSFCETCCSSASCRRASSNSACIWQNESDCNVCDREKHGWVEGSRVETHCPRLPGIRIKLINPSSQGLLSNISHEPAEAVWLHLAFRLPRVVQCFHHVLPVESEQQNCGSKVETFHFSIFTPFAAAHCVHVTVRLSTQAVASSLWTLQDLGSIPRACVPHALGSLVMPVTCKSGLLKRKPTCLISSTKAYSIYSPCYMTILLWQL